MLSRIGHRVLAADLDPQSNLTAAFLDDEALELLWRDRDPLPPSVRARLDARFPAVPIPTGAGTIADSVRPLQEQTGDVRFYDPVPITGRLSLLPGDLALSGFEDKLSVSWPPCFTGDIGALRVTSAFHRLIQDSARRVSADVTIIDVGPNLGAINRAALLCADRVLMPLAAELFSLRGLSNLGPVLRAWRTDWQETVVPRAANGLLANELPHGEMNPIGYVVMQQAMRLNRPMRAYERWLVRIPVVYSEAVLNEQVAEGDIWSHEIAKLRNYQSLMPLAHDARKPMFDLRPGDGAIGATGDFVRRCYEDFEILASDIAQRLGLRKDTES
jgi:cellulose biosynthesis protein BcsQ